MSERGRYNPTVADEKPPRTGLFKKVLVAAGVFLAGERAFTHGAAEKGKPTISVKKEVPASRDHHKGTQPDQSQAADNGEEEELEEPLPDSDVDEAKAKRNELAVRLKDRIFDQVRGTFVGVCDDNGECEFSLKNRYVLKYRFDALGNCDVYEDEKVHQLIEAGYDPDGKVMSILADALRAEKEKNEIFDQIEVYFKDGMSIDWMMTEKGIEWISLSELYELYWSGDRTGPKNYEEKLREFLTIPVYEAE